MVHLSSSTPQGLRRQRYQGNLSTSPRSTSTNWFSHSLCHRFLPPCFLPGPLRGVSSELLLRWTQGGRQGQDLRSSLFQLQGVRRPRRTSHQMGRSSLQSTKEYSRHHLIFNSTFSYNHHQPYLICSTLRLARNSSNRRTHSDGRRRDFNFSTSRSSHQRGEKSSTNPWTLWLLCRIGSFRGCLPSRLVSTPKHLSSRLRSLRSLSVGHQPRANRMI